MPTLLRLRELLSLRRDHVDLRAGVIHVQAANRQEAVDLSARARQLLQIQLTSHSHAWVFPGRSAGWPMLAVAVWRHFRSAVQATGVGYIRFHDLRRYVLRLGLQAGIPVRVLKQRARYRVPSSAVGPFPVTEIEWRTAADGLARAVFDARP
jgi:integrase